MPWYVIDNRRRVWAECQTPKAASNAKIRIVAQIRKGRFARAPDPATLRIVNWNPTTEQTSRVVDTALRK